MGNVQGFLLFFKGKQLYYLQVPIAKYDMLCDEQVPQDWDFTLRNTAFINLNTCK